MWARDALPILFLREGSAVMLGLYVSRGRGRGKVYVARSYWGRSVGGKALFRVMTRLCVDADA